MSQDDLDELARGLRPRIKLPRQKNMRVPLDSFNSVAFVGYVSHSGPDGDEIEYCGTGFFVTYPAEQLPTSHFIYFVTAAHVVKGLGDKDVRIIANKKGGGIKEIKPMGDTFIGHHDGSSTDVALIPISRDDELDVTYTTPDMFALKDLDEGRIGVGDETFAVGLFIFATGGADRIHPIIRHGNIAMLPTEQIQTSEGYADVYLIEARSIGGLSGSPVFARRTIVVADSEPTMYVHGEFMFIGILQGHWDISESHMNRHDYFSSLRHGVNIGVAVVTPAYKLIELLERDEMKYLRARITERYKQLESPTPDGDNGPRGAA